MESKGIQVRYLDDTFECFDPIQDFIETSSEYSFWIGGYTYEIPKDTVLNIREYDLCDDCGYELFDDGCRRCFAEKELEKLKNNL